MQRGRVQRSASHEAGEHTAVSLPPCHGSNILVHNSKEAAVHTAHMQRRAPTMRSSPRSPARPVVVPHETPRPKSVSHQQRDACKTYLSAKHAIAMGFKIE